MYHWKCNEKAESACDMKPGYVIKGVLFYKKEARQSKGYFWADNGDEDSITSSQIIKRVQEGKTFVYESEEEIESLKEFCKRYKGFWKKKEDI